MYKACNNLGLFYELNLLIEYIENDITLELLNKLIKEFNMKGLSHKDIKVSINLIETYLPSYIGCTVEGCYLHQNIDNIETYTYFKESNTTKINSKKNLNNLIQVNYAL